MVSSITTPVLSELHAQVKDGSLKLNPGQPEWLRGLALPSTQGLILETPDQVPLRAPCMEPASPSACVSGSLSVSFMNE